MSKSLDNKQIIFKGILMELDDFDIVNNNYVAKKEGLLITDQKVVPGDFLLVVSENKSAFEVISTGSEVEKWILKKHNQNL